MPEDKSNYLNVNTRVSSDDGDYVILTDEGGYEGMSLISQHITCNEAVDAFHQNSDHQNKVLVKLVKVKIQEVEEESDRK